MPADSCDAPVHPRLADTQALPAFAALGVHPALVKVLDEQGIAAPFPVQAATLPDALAGRDILGRARTGSGKTLGFSLPLVSRLAGGSSASRRPRGLVLVPTRELATQVSEVLKPLARAMDLKVTVIYGGVSYGPQVTALRRGTDIVVATPGRLVDLIGQGECDLADVAVTVIDEADQMADLGFLPVVRRLLEATPAGGQRMLFSATLDAAIDVLARRFLSDPVLHSVDEHSSPAEIEHYVLTVEPASRVAVLAALAGGEMRSLVFTRTKHGAERLARQLTQAGIPAAELHGNLRQGARTRNLEAFSTGLARVMVATDIAARGIHIDGIELVIHADPPTEHKAYVHRSGRTARGGADGMVVTLQTRAQARDVSAMMHKAAIIPHAAVTVDPQSAVLAEIAGPPAARVSVQGKVAALVEADDRLARNDGAGPRRAGRPRRGRKPRGDQFRDRGDGAPAAAGRQDRADRPPRTERAERPARGDRGDRSERADRPARGDHGTGDGAGRRDSQRRGDGRPGNGQRREGPRGDGQYRDDRPARSDRNDWYPKAAGERSSSARFRPAGGPQRPAEPGSHPARDGGNRGERGRSGSGNQPRGGRPGRAQPGSRVAGSPPRSGNSAGRGRGR